MRARIEMIGRLKCRVLDDLAEGATPSLIVFLCHGYGASGTDLVPIGQELMSDRLAIRQNVQFVFPEAPLSLDHLGLPGGRAWWHLDLMKLQIAVATGQFRDLRSERPDGLSDATEQLTETITAWSQKSGVPLTKVILGGFSQGAMLSMDVGLHLATNPACVVAMSGTLLNEGEWRELAPRHSGLRVLQSHGRHDPLLPFAAAEWLRDLLVESGLKVDFVDFAGEHQIPIEVFEKLTNIVEELARAKS